MSWVPRTCIYCGKEFEAPPWAIKRGRGKVCSLDCPGKPKKVTATKTRNLVRLDKLQPGDRFFIDNRRGRVLERHLLYDAVRIKIYRRIYLWHRAICVEPVQNAPGSTEKPDLPEKVLECHNGQQGGRNDLTRGSIV